MFGEYDQNKTVFRKHNVNLAGGFLKAAFLPQLEDLTGRKDRGKVRKMLGNAITY